MVRDDTAEKEVDRVKGSGAGDQFTTQVVAQISLSQLSLCACRHMAVYFYHCYDKRCVFGDRLSHIGVFLRPE